VNRNLNFLIRTTLTLCRLRACLVGEHHVPDEDDGQRDVEREEPDEVDVIHVLEVPRRPSQVCYPRSANPIPIILGLASLASLPYR